MSSESERWAEVLVVVPAYNEEATVAGVIESVTRCGLATLVVDDGSVDGTAEVAERAGATVLRLPINLGVGGALRCGFRYAVAHGFSVVVQCDADDQHDPDEIAKLLDTMEARDADLVVGSRFADGAGAYEIGIARRLAMRQLARMTSRRVGATVTDPTSGFRAIGPRLLGPFAASFPAEYLGDTVEAIARAGESGYRVAEVGVSMKRRAEGVSTASSLASVWYIVRVITAIKLQRYRPRGRRTVQLTRWERPPT